VGASGGTARQRTIRIDSIVTEVNFVDVGPVGASLGDEIVFSEKLLDGGKQIGHEGAVCTTVSMERNEAQCIATFSFPDGEITVQGLSSWVARHHTQGPSLEAPVDTRARPANYTSPRSRPRRASRPSA
jgi:hypothetical protein